MPPRSVVGHSLHQPPRSYAHLIGSTTIKYVEHTRETVLADFGIVGVWAALSSHYVPPRRVVGHSLQAQELSEDPEPPNVWTTLETVSADFGILGVWAALSSHYVPSCHLVFERSRE